MKAKVKSKAAVKKAKKAKNSKASFTVNNRQIKWSVKWNGWEVFKEGKLIQMFRHKKDAKEFAIKGYIKL